MKHSRRYQKIKEQIPSSKVYSVSEGIKFLQGHNEEKSKNIEVSFSLNWVKQKNKNTLKSKIIFPNPFPLKSNLAIIKENLPQPLIEELQKKNNIELLTISELQSRIKKEDGKIKKKPQWGFAKLLAYPESEKNIKPLERILGPKGAYPTKKNGLLTENILEEVNKFSQGEREIKTDKGGNIHMVLGKNDFNLGALEENYKTLHSKITSLKPKGWKGAFLRTITLSTTMGPGLKVLL
jgi:large subunit ribosomal protein L1